MTRTRSLLIILCLLAASTTAAQPYESENASLQLGGSSYLSIAYDDAFNVDIARAAAISIDAWVRPTQSGQLMCIVGNDRNVSSYWFGLSPQRRLRFYPNPAYHEESSSTIPLNTWTHVGVSFDASGNEMKFYINGALDRQIKTGQSYLGYGYFDLRIGADRDNAGPADYWTGGIDEVRIWRSVVDFSNAAGLLYRIPWAMAGGLHGRFLQGAWRLNGNALAAVGGHNGSNVGSVSYAQTPDPPHYQRISLIVTNGPDRGDHVTIPNDPALTLTQNFTLECWVRPATGGHAQFQTFLTKGSHSANRWNYWLGLNKSNGRVRFLPTGNWQLPLESKATLSLNTWTHVAARFERSGNGSIATIFINGIPDQTQTYTTTGSGNKDELLIGSADVQSTGTTAYGYSGAIDEVRIWNTARTDDQIADHHRMEFEGPTAGLVAVYRFQGDDLDRSGSGLHGTGSFRTSSQAYFADASSLPSLPSLTLLHPTGGERWDIGDSETVKWNATGLVNLRVELSRDGGKTFSEVLAPSVAANAGGFQWTVTGPPVSNDAVVRIRPPSTIMLEDASAPFSIEDPVPVLDVRPRQLVFTVYQNGPAPQAQYIHLRNTGGKTLSWTASKTSAQWYDLTPGSGTSNEDSVRVEITDTQLSIGTYSDNVTIGGNAANAGILVNVVCNVVPAVSYEISGKVKSTAGNPAEGVRMVVVGTMSTEAFTDENGEYVVTGLVPGDYSVAPASPYFSFTPASRTVSGLSGNQTDWDFISERAKGDIVIRFAQGWNLISLPLPLSPSGVEDLFPAAEGKAYEYVPEKGYVEAEELEYGKGYWIKFSREDSIVVSGSYTTAMEVMMEDEFGGWNLIGAPSGPVPLAAVQTDPAGALIAIYDYHPELGYIEPEGGVLRPGRGYFAKVNTEALLRMIVQSFAPGELPEVDALLRLPAAYVRPLPPPPPRE
ncbi:MAG: carboxypeptidase regulatory-like domain-containing protein [Bacteroidetes bacterium]|nr:carboxypeptidase regulatory-like domain-containing protein [Bacteroidota bacterium]